MKPILFNTEMVKAILDRRKTQFRIAIKINQNNYDFDSLVDEPRGLIAYLTTKNPINYPTEEIESKYKKGDILYVRETFMEHPISKKVIYKANNESMYYADHLAEFEAKWKPSVHMPIK